MEPIALFLKAFVMLFAIIDPVGNLPIFLSLTSEAPRREQARIAKRAALIACVILLAFALVGRTVIDHFGGFAYLEIAGGILLFTLTMRDLVLEKPSYRAAEDVAAVPLGTPLLAGPGAITTVMILMGSLGPLITLPAVLANGVVIWLTFTAGAQLSRLLGKTGMRVLDKLLSLVIIAMSIYFIWNGILQLLAKL